MLMLTLNSLLLWTHIWHCIVSQSWCRICLISLRQGFNHPCYLVVAHQILITQDIQGYAVWLSSDNTDKSSHTHTHRNPNGVQTIPLLGSTQKTQEPAEEQLFQRGTCWVHIVSQGHRHQRKNRGEYHLWKNATDRFTLPRIPVPGDWQRTRRIQPIECHANIQYSPRVPQQCCDCCWYTLLIDPCCVSFRDRVCVCCLYPRWIGRPSCAELTLSPRLAGCMERSEPKPSPLSPTVMEEASVCPYVCVFRDKMT